MAMKVSIGFTGSAIVYFKLGVWNIVMVSDHCHKVKFAHPLTGGVYQDFAHTGNPRTVTFRAPGATQATGWGAGEPDKFLNMSDSRMHDKFSATESNLVKRVVPRNGRQYVHLKIPFGTVKGGSGFGTPYYYERVGTGAKIPLGKSVTTGFGLKFDVPDGVDLTLAIDDVTHPNPIVFQSGPAAIALDFNNYCDECSTDNDFINHYDWVCDRRSLPPAVPIQWVAGEFDDVCTLKVEPTKENIERFELELKELHTMRANEKFSWDMALEGPAGDCDPVIIEPPPGD